jgi:leucyl aminopeptidase (aminopeptidase T)
MEMIMDELISKAGKTIVETCSRLMPSETATVVTDRETGDIGETIWMFAEQIAEKVKFHVLEDYAERPLTFLPDEIEADIKKSDVIYFAAQSKPGELKDFRGPLVKLATSVGREIHMPNIEEKVMKSGMQANYYKVASLTYSLMGTAVKSKTARVQTPAGTDLKATFSAKLKWVPDTGLLWHRGMFGNLPAGETFTCPETVDGVMVVDGILGDFFNQKYRSLEKTPVTIPVKGSRAQIDDITCDNKELLKDLREYLTQDENANRVGEFACGTNTSLKELIGNLLQDEKFPGVHVAFGFPYPGETGADWESGGHVDGIMKRCNVWFDKTQIMKDGTYTLNGV